MIIDRNLSTELNIDTRFINTDNPSIIENITNNPDNYVNFSDKGKLLLSIVTLGISYVIINLIEDHNKEKSRSECINITKKLLSSFDNIKGEQKTVHISLPKGETLKISERFCEKENKYQTVIEYKKCMSFRLGKYNESKSYVDKSFQEIKKMLIKDIISHESDYSFRDGSLVTLAKNIHQKDIEDLNKKKCGEYLIKFNNLENPIVYDEKNIEVKLRETFQEGFFVLSFIEKQNIRRKKHLLLGIVTPDNQSFILSTSSGNNRIINNNGGCLRYIKLGTKENITEVDNNLMDKLKKLKPQQVNIPSIINEIYRINIFQDNNHINKAV
ncbi:MAG TPA: hypothetical protein ACHBZ9_04145 [Arsenophonus nasoniae]|uniref:hypothetical protein n=1 Tax=Arsenophonus nasoniae TaxID=638 RepID=UPI003879BAEF